MIYSKTDLIFLSKKNLDETDIKVLFGAFYVSFYTINYFITMDILSIILIVVALGA